MTQKATEQLNQIVVGAALGRRSDAGMTCFHGYETDAMLAVYDFSEVRVLADIGGGNGSLISSVFRSCAIAAR